MHFEPEGLNTSIGGLYNSWKSRENYREATTKEPGLEHQGEGSWEFTRKVWLTCTHGSRHICFQRITSCHQSCLPHLTECLSPANFNPGPYGERDSGNCSSCLHCTAQETSVALAVMPRWLRQSDTVRQGPHTSLYSCLTSKNRKWERHVSA